LTIFEAGSVAFMICLLRINPRLHRLHRTYVRPCLPT